MRLKHIRIKLFKNQSVLLSKPKKYIYLFLKMFFTGKQHTKKFVQSLFSLTSEVVKSWNVQKVRASTSSVAVFVTTMSIRDLLGYFCCV